MNELRPVPGFPGTYAADDGSIWGTTRAGGSIRRLSPRKTKAGKGATYLSLSVRDDQGVYCHVRVHRLVAAAFLGIPKQGQVVRHLNGRWFDNRADNLAYGSQADNMADAVKHGTTARGVKNPSSKLTADQVTQIKAYISAGQRGVDIAEMFGVSQQTICDIKMGRIWGHVSGK